jgi:predicted N-acyltransferase
MSFDVQIAHGVEQFSEEVWDRLSGDRPFTSHRWYRFGERAMAYDTPMYVILFRQGEPLARATFWLTSREFIPAQSTLIQRLLETMMRRWPLLICQSALPSASAASGLLLPEPPLRDAALSTIAEVARELARQHRASFCLFAYLEESETRWPGWPAIYASTAIPGPGTHLDIIWPDFEDYLCHLSKKRRYNIRRNARLAAEQGIEVRCHSTVKDVDAALALHQKVNKRFGARTEPWMRGAMENAGMVDSLWLTAEVDGRLVGCELMLSDRDGWLVTGLGLDYSVDYVYFLLGYEDIRLAIERGARVLRWGSETYQVKQRLGFQIESNIYATFSGRFGLLHRVGRWMAAVEESHVEQPYATQGVSRSPG